MEQTDKDALTKLRLHMSANPESARAISEAIAKIAADLNIELSRDVYENLVIIHRTEMDTDISVTLPVGSQCGF